MRNDNQETNQRTHNRFGNSRGTDNRFGSGDYPGQVEVVMTTRKRIQSNMTLEAAIQAYKREMEISGIKILSTQECQIGLEALEKVKYLREIQGLPLPLPSETERG